MGGRDHIGSTPVIQVRNKAQLALYLLQGTEKGEGIVYMAGPVQVVCCVRGVLPALKSCQGSIFPANH